MSDLDQEQRFIEIVVGRCPHPEAPLGPGDDAALLPPPPTAQRVIGADMMVEGTHFLQAHPPALLGQKLLAVNLSDVAAMGATPEGFTLSAALPDDIPLPWWELFSGGLGDYARRWKVELVGGDVVRTRGPVSLSVSAWGHVSHPGPLRRDGAEAGDTIMVLGALGRSSLGLERWLSASHAAGWGAHSSEALDPLLLHHLAPDPDLSAGPWALQEGAHAAMDLSDGLQMDAPRLARASGLTLELDLSLLPEDPLLLHLSPQQRAAGGEDLGLLVSVPPARVEVFQRRGFTSLGRALTKQDEGYVRWLEDGREVHLTSEPFRHFSQERGPDS